jgi:hypothetical protein
MGPNSIFILNKLRNVYTRMNGKKAPYYLPEIKLKGQQASDHIKRIIEEGKPAMIARFGSVEAECFVTWYLQQKNSFFKNCTNYIKGRSDIFWWSDEIKFQMFNNAGFFPADENSLSKFSELILNDLKELDVLGSWLEREKYFGAELEGKTLVPLVDIEPYYHSDPWSTALKGKKVLVIHPYDRTIEQQYTKRELLFRNKNILPEFHLQTIRSVQSITGNKTEFPTWFDALDSMKKRISASDFDVAIIGCGAYGFPLAAHVKRMGKIAIHLGGATQILFGIKGKRWEDISFFREMFNEHWVRPSEEETPKNFTGVENGCYW